MQPIDSSQCQQIILATDLYRMRAETLFDQAVPPIDLLFDLTGRCAGMYRVRGGQRVIRYNPYIFAKHFDMGMTTTVPHEVAHYVTDLMYGLGRVRAHGKEWRAVMRAFGVEPRATGVYDLDGVPVRRQRRFPYHCGCGLRHELSSCRHNRVERGQARYLCRRCGSGLQRIESGHEDV